MYLRYIFLKPNWDSRSIKEYDKSILERFQYNCYFVYHYLCIAVRKKRFLTDETYNAIGVSFSFSEQLMNYDPVAWKSLHNLHCSLLVSPQDFELYRHESNLENRYEFYLSCLERGYKYINQHKEIPVDMLLSLHDEFRQNGYKNEILFKSLCIRPFGLKVTLTKVLTTIDFQLVLCAYDIKSGQLLARGPVFRTAPDDIHYNYHFKQVKLVENKLLILDFLARPSFSIDIPSLSNGQVIVEYAGSNFNEEKQKKQNEIIKTLIW